MTLVTMVNIEAQLKTDLTTLDFLALFLSATRDLSGCKNYTLITADALSTASARAKETIDYCKKNELITIVPSGGKCFEFHITDKGVSEHKGLALRERVRRRNLRR